MKTITSPENPAFRQAVSLKQKKARDKTGCYLIEGPNLIREALENGAEIDCVFCLSDPKEQSDSARAEIDVLVRELTEIRARVHLLPGSLFSKLSDTVTPQGILAVVKKMAVQERSFFKEGGNLVVLDRLQDPGNLGTVMRTAEAAEFSGVLVIKGTGDIYSPKTVRSAAGSLFRLPVYFVDSAEAAVSLLRTYNKTIFATVVSSGTAYYETDLRRNAALIVGNEGNGISPFLTDQADERITIPMGEKSESLNAAIACAVVMYESVRQNRVNMEE